MICFYNFSEVSAQTIKRWSGGKKEIATKQIHVQTRANIFKDFGWTEPDVQSAEIHLENGNFQFQYKNNIAVISKSADNEMIFTNGSTETITSIKKISDAKIYYDKQALKLKSIQKKRWVSYQTTVMQSRPVVKYRTVTTYQYDYSTKTSRPVSTQQSYVAYEMHHVPQTRWKWETYSTYELDIPKYEYYSFILPDSNQFIVYEITENQQKSYFLQNISYLSAIDKDGVNHILIDNNHNGNYTDAKDQLFFNSWNPHSEKSAFRKIQFFKENSWYNLIYLQEEYFVSVKIENDSLNLNYQNDEFSKSESKGKVSFVNFPDDAKVEINSRSYNIKPKKQYKTEYGFFKITASRQGYLDFVKTYTVDDKNTLQEIHYEPTYPAVLLEIADIFTDDYYIIVSANNYYKIYYKKDKIKLPIGENKIEVYTDGSTFTYNLKAEEGKNIILNFELEIQKKE